MKVIQPFFLGAVGGLVLAVLIASGLYLSPLRQGLYLGADPEITGLRARLGGLQEKLTGEEMGIAQAASQSQPADSLKTSQAKSWQEYKRWRNRLGELARVHERATPAGIWAWTYSLRYWAFPLAAFLALFPGALLALRSSRRARAGRAYRVQTPPPAASARKENFSSFESAVKQVARIASTQSVPTLPRQTADRSEAGEKETEYLPEISPDDEPETRRMEELEGRVLPDAGPLSRMEPPHQPESLMARPGHLDPPQGEPSPYDMVQEQEFVRPETSPFPPRDPHPDRNPGTETQIMQMGPGWGKPLHPGSGERFTRPPEELSMEDEDGVEEEEPPSGAFMPPTTEVERVERRKAEVLKLARKGLTSSEISRRLRISQDQVEFIIRLRREKG